MGSKRSTHQSKLLFNSPEDQLKYLCLLALAHRLSGRESVKEDLDLTNMGFYTINPFQVKLQLLTLSIRKRKWVHKRKS